MPIGPEWIVVLLLAVLLFGGGRIAKLGGELGAAIKEFRKGVSDDKKDAAKLAEEAEKKQN
jgi:sec-independent protein translocase protein TatA